MRRIGEATTVSASSASALPPWWKCSQMLLEGCPHYLLIKCRGALHSLLGQAPFSAARGGRGEEVLVLEGARVLQQPLESAIFVAASKQRGTSIAAILG
jgi:hypothetical protein